jgi:ABC-2 type transport system ATP-binding protein
MIELERATKKYGAIYGLRDVTVRIGRGETVGLLGRNGAGKTTALNLITGYFPPTEGTVRIGGMDMLESARECRRMIGYLPERPPLYDEMTTEEYLRFVCELREVTAKAIPAHVDEILILCGLQEMRGRLLGHMSKGYRQRAGIAQALCGSPEILIFDEPTVGLDPKQTVEMRELIRRLGEEHTVVFSSHILSEVQQICSRVIILEEGRMVLDHDANAAPDGLIRLRLKIAGKEDAVMKRLRHLDGFAAVELLPAEETETVEARVTLERGSDSGAALDRAFRILADSGLPVRLMREEREDLEEVFLRTIQSQL